MMIAYKRFHALLVSASECETFDQFAAECGSVAIDDDDMSKTMTIIKAVWDMAHDGLTIKSIAQACDSSVRSIAVEYGISTRTLENWASGTNTPPAWVLPAIAYAVLSDYVEDVCATI